MATMARQSLVLVLTLVPACTAWWPELEDACDGCTTTGDVPPHEPAPVQTVTSDGDSTSGEGGSSTSIPQEVPVLGDVVVTPTELEASGPIKVTARAEHAEGVRMYFGDTVVELVEVAPGEFVGEIAVYSGLSNGPHEVTLIPWRGDVDGASTVIPFEVSLPEPGSLGFWEAAGLLGEGQATAAAGLPGTDEFVEAGTVFVDGQPRCYLRRRAKGGAWSDTDVILVLPDEACVVTDLVIDENGIHLLATREIFGSSRWWLARMTSWGSDLEHVGLGAVGEEATALAAEAGEVAVCGNKQQVIDRDAFVSLFHAGRLGEQVKPFDYMPDGQDHVFDEHVADCVYNGETLILGGAAFGPHDVADNDWVMRERGFLLEFDTTSDSHVWRVFDKGPGAVTQSAVTALAIDDEKRAVSAGYTCEDVCLPAAELRGSLGGELFWQTDLPDVLPPDALVWSPAGYVVVASALPRGPLWTAFWMQAWRPSLDAPVWTFVRDDAPSLQMARTVVIGYFGLVLGLGVGAENVPAVAIVNG